MTGHAEIDGAAFTIDAATRLDDRPSVGERAELRAVVQTDGSVLAERLESN